jgi:hypothetical protein
VVAVATPDVRVRLSAEGVAEVVSAFKKVRDQADRTAKIGKKGFGGLNGSISATSGLLSELSGVLAGIGFAAFVKQAGDAAETLSLIKERFGASAADVSILDTALQGMQSSLAESEKALGKLLVKTGEAADGLRTAEQEFFALGLSAKEVKDLANQDFVQRLETIAAAAAKLPDGPQKTETLFRLLGARGAVLIPLFRKMGKEGLEPLRREAERLGSVLDEDILANAAKINEGLDDLAAVGRGLSAQFAAGIGPGLKAGLEAVVDEIVSGKGAWQQFGEIAGKMIGFTIVLVSTMVDSLHTAFTTLAANFVSLARGFAAAATGNFEEAGVHFESIGLRYERENALLAERVNRAWDKFFNPTDNDPLKRLLDSFAEGAEGGANKFDRLARERALVEKARIDGQLKAVKAGLSLQEQAETEAFERGLTDVKTYYDERRRIVTEGLDAEAKAIADKLAEVKKDTTIQGIAEQRALEAQLALIPQRKEKEIADLGSKERRDVEEIALKRLELDRKVFEARGDQHEAILAGIDEEIRKASILLGQQNAPNADAILESLRLRLTAQADFDEAAARGARELEAIGRESAAISDRQSAGLIGQGTALERIAKIEQDRIPRLHSGSRPNSPGTTRGSPRPRPSRGRSTNSRWRSRRRGSRWTNSRPPARTLSAKASRRSSRTAPETSRPSARRSPGWSPGSSTRSGG